MQKTEKSKTNEGAVEKMFEAGVQYGFGKSRRHPSMSPFIYTTKNRTDIIDLEKVGDMLDGAKAFLETLGAKSANVLLVGTKPEAKDAIIKMATRLDMPYVTERWIGGTLSNFGEIKKRITELENYQKSTTTGDLSKYTKKERVVLAKKMEKLARYYQGLLTLKKAPDALFVVDAKAEHIAVTEAVKAGIPVVALMNTDTNLKNVKFPIVGNDAAIPSIKFFTTVLGDAYEAGKDQTKK
ncbi:MAG: 30S ribosomal protein S2 [Candidatus Pacebacteria bacterium]|nr:30S ribosomal protein S2 [Candidatus Paceibacterota bacterium]MBP9851414.1 30S ribosomal protein S2 [Candidatus Paceibacterota bacterium]